MSDRVRIMVTIESGECNVNVLEAPDYEELERATRIADSVRQTVRDRLNEERAMT